MKVLVTGLGTVTAKGVVDSLQRLGARIVGIDINDKRLLASSLKTESFYTVPAVEERDAYLKAVLNVVELEKIDFVIPILDEEVLLLSQHASELARADAILCAPPPEVVRRCSDKRKIFDYLSDRGIPDLIPTMSLSDAGINGGVRFPAFIKPRFGRASVGCMKLDDRIDLDYVSAKRGSSDDYIIQPFIEGLPYVVDVVANQGHEAITAIPRREYIKNKNGVGTAVQIEMRKDLIERAKGIAIAVGMIGACNIEFIVDGAVLHFLEINPRFSAGNAYSRLAGVDIAQLVLDVFSGCLRPVDQKVRDGMYIARSYEEYVVYEK